MPRSRTGSGASAAGCATYGALDFAGGTVVHITAGVAALVAAIMLGKRIGFGSGSLEPHNLTYTVLGAGLLWFGWFGFNAGSALGANGLAANALVVTNTAAAMGGLAWMTASWFRHGHPSVLGLAAGAVAGLVAITPAAGFVDTPASILIGLGAGIFCFFAVDILKRNVGVDDALDVFAVHGVGGIWGALATGLFATTAVNPAGADGLFYGNPGQLLKQAVAVVAVGAFTAARDLDHPQGRRRHRWPARAGAGGSPRSGHDDARRGGVPVVGGEDGE